MTPTPQEKVEKRTPWGAADHVTWYTGAVSVDGTAHARLTQNVAIPFYSTPSHGGLEVPQYAFVLMPKCIREASTFTQGCAGHWYEEDCDFALVVLAFPSLFSEWMLVGAVETALGGIMRGSKGWDAVREWLLAGEGSDRKSRADAFKAKHATSYRMGSYSTSGKGWRASVSRLDESERLVIDFPTDQGIESGFYTLKTPFTLEDIERAGGTIIKREAA